MSSLQLDASKWDRKGSVFENVNNARQLAEAMVDKAQKHFEAVGSHSNNFFFVTRDEVHMVHTPMTGTSENERVAMGNLGLKLYMELDAEGMGTVGECWYLPQLTTESHTDNIECTNLT